MRPKHIERGNLEQDTRLFLNKNSILCDEKSIEYISNRRYLFECLKRLNDQVVRDFSTHVVGKIIGYFKDQEEGLESINLDILTDVGIDESLDLLERLFDWWITVEERVRASVSITVSPK